MTNQGLGTIEMLRERKKWLQEEIRQIDVALVAMGVESSVQKQGYVKSRPSDGVQWSDKVDEVFAHNDGELNFKGVAERLVELGLQEAQDKKHKPSITACLARKVKQEKIERARPGFYRRKSKDAILFDQNPTEEIK
ncbi:MAG: hypothetical protein L6406_13145 [Desulfobacterales bacterium]|nr:hypothetical protein [Desulfobacterales bacterium]